LAPASFWVFIQAWLLLARIDLQMRLQSYVQWQSILFEPTVVKKVKQQHQVSALIVIAEMAARNHWCQMNCLRRTLAEKSLLAQHGIDSHVHIGVRKNNASTLTAHAWLSVEGQVVNDSAEVIGRYHELAPSKWQIGLNNT